MLSGEGEASQRVTLVAPQTKKELKELGHCSQVKEFAKLSSPCLDKELTDGDCDDQPDHDVG